VIRVYSRLLTVVLGEHFGKIFEENPTIVKRILMKALEAARGRDAARKAPDLVRRKGVLEGGGLPGKRQSRRLSILIIPDDGSRTREFKMGYGAIRGLLLAETLLLVLVILGGVLHWRSLNWEAEALRMTRDNKGLRSEMRQVDELAESVSRMKAIDRQLRAMLSPVIDLPRSAASDREDSPSISVGTRPAARTVSTTAIRGMSVSDTRLVPDVWPVGRFEGLVTKEFVPIAGTIKAGHQGIDIAASEGALVTATADGRIAFAGEDETLGLVLSVDHFGAYLTRYGHNSVLLVRTGDAVRKGQPIALVGNTGRSSGPHLHYEIWQHGTPRNPRNFLPES
jgi:hypothetical protein